MLHCIWRKAKRWEENSYQESHPWASGTAARSYKEITDVWEPEQSSGEKRWPSPAEKGACAFAPQLCPERQDPAADDLPARPDFPPFGGPGCLAESLTCLLPCKSFRAFTLSWSPARRRWVAVAAAVKSSSLCWKGIYSRFCSLSENQASEVKRNSEVKQRRGWKSSPSGLDGHSKAQGRGASRGHNSPCVECFKRKTNWKDSGKILRQHDRRDRVGWRREVLAEISGQVGGEGWRMWQIISNTNDIKRQLTCSVG